MEAVHISRKLSVKEAATFLGISKGYLDKLRVYGGSPHYFKIGARILYDVSDLEQWLIDRRITNTSQNPKA
ncbi:helix-turn-helix transcriptional regulator [Tardiphaga robiniae]|uniref:Helix-turn-helix domain-containing protein n=1 Tax=Tardiphaga robiniae TaxID=943830 RepID=A0A164B9G5_9BRAD|nr:helix-turn-helix domain-containing protein [Tardiphaga robiniae]KZD25977.1 hypothetical protein A4A58_04635 [Tardiphaga robiniae]